MNNSIMEESNLLLKICSQSADHLHHNPFYFLALLTSGFADYCVASQKPAKKLAKLEVCKTRSRIKIYLFLFFVLTSYF